MVPLPEFKTYCLTSSPPFPVVMDPMPTTTTTTKEEMLQMAREMVMMRRMESECDTLYVTGKIHGSLNLYDGEVDSFNVDQL